MRRNTEIKTTTISSKNKELHFSSLAGLRVNAYENIWTLLAHNGKGARVKVDWVHSENVPKDDRILILDVLMYYARTKAASTTSGVITNAGPYLKYGIPTLVHLKTIWSGLKTNQKKGLNQFFGTLKNLGNREFEEYHKYTSSRLDKYKRKSLDTNKGALSELEFDSLSKQINSNIRSFDWKAERPLTFYQTADLFGSLRNSLTNRMLLSIVRRPIQLSMMKWSDVVPAGSTFNDSNIRPQDEIGTIGAQTLQIRVFIAKIKGCTSPRGLPERYPLHLSEELSYLIYQYKNFYRYGIMLLLNSNLITYDDSELTQMMKDMPVFPSHKLFSMNISSLDAFKSYFTKISTAYHVSEALITCTLRYVRFESERDQQCIATSNRIRHTVLTRGAQDGLSAEILAKITGVTVPAVRHYIDLDYKSRKLVDDKYLGNDFLKRIFVDPISYFSNDDDCILDNEFNPIGGIKTKATCDTCLSAQGKPVGCYGCKNFRPILEANHRAVLSLAQDKREANLKSLINPLLMRSIEKLDKQIEQILYTIKVCDEILSKQRAIDVK